MIRKLLYGLAAVVIFSMYSCDDDDNNHDSFTYDGKRTHLTQAVVYRYKFPLYHSYPLTISLLSGGFDMQDGYIASGKGDIVNLNFTSSSDDLPEGFYSSSDIKFPIYVTGLSIQQNYDHETKKSDADLVIWSECNVHIKKMRNEYFITFDGILNEKHFSGAYSGPLIVGL